MELLVESGVGDPKKILRDYRMIGLMYMSLAYAIMFIMVLMVLTSDISPFEPASLVLMAIGVSLAAFATFAVIKRWNDGKCAAIWGLLLEMSEAKEWISQERLETDIKMALARGGLSFDRSVEFPGFDLETWGFVTKYDIGDGLSITWNRVAQSIIGGHHGRYVLNISIVGITSSNYEKAIRVYNLLRRMEILRLARSGTH